MTEPAAVQPRKKLIYLHDGELEALMRDAGGPGNGRVVQCAFGFGAIWLDPATRDAQGRYPRWVVLRLAVLRGISVAGEDLTEQEQAELTEFAAKHGREVKA